MDPTYDITLELKRISESSNPCLDETQREFLRNVLIDRYAEKITRSDDELLLAEAEDRGVI